MTRTLSGHSAIVYSLSPFLKKGWIPGRLVWVKTHRVYLPLFLRMAVLLDIKVKPHKQRNTWSYYYRQARMSSGTSDHAGYACDFWSDDIGAHTWPSRMSAIEAANMSAVLEKFKTASGKHIFGWGACNLAPGVVYTGPTYDHPESHDPMHVFIAPGVTWADAREVIKRMGIQPDGKIR